MHRASLPLILVAILTIACASQVARAQDGSRVHLVEEADGYADETQQAEDMAAESPFGFASMLYQPPPTLQETVPQPAARPGTTGGRQSGIRLARVPNMYGDQGMTTARARVEGSGQVAFFQSEFTLPTAQGTRSVKMAENDTPLPVDRVFFNYNHFHNVFEVSERPLNPPGPEVVTQRSIDRYTVGFEKTFFDGGASVELRLPFIGTYDTQLQSVGVDGGNFGNLAVVLKGLVYEDDITAVGAGMGISTPTGSDTVGRFGDAQLRFHNEAVHLLPYIGFMVAPGDPRWGWNDGLFFTGFAQIDIAANGNNVVFTEPTSEPLSLGKLTEQTLLYLDASVGYWLYRDPYAYRCTGVAAIGEIHYTTTLQDADRLVGAGIQVGSTKERFDVVNGTIGLQFLLFDLSSLRVAGVFPLGDEDERFFDSEVQVQFNRRF